MRAGLKVTGLAALLAGVGAASAAAAEPASPAASVIPMPADVAPQSGAFPIRRGVEILSAKDPEVRRIAAYFAALLRESHGLSLEVRVRGNSGLPGHAITFVLDPQASGASAESYQLEVQPARVTVSAREPRGLFYGAVTLWQL